MDNLKPGVIRFISEIVADEEQYADESVRVVGRVVEYDAEALLVTLEEEGARLRVDLSLLVRNGYSDGDLRVELKAQVQCIGELRALSAPQAQHGLVLKARVMVDKQGMDPQLYKRAVLVRRKFDAWNSELVPTG
jgi:hypothetical protein